jgi:hypothetical protein
MRLVGGLMGVTQEEETLTVEPDCGWAVVYEEPVDPLSQKCQWLEDRSRGANKCSGRRTAIGLYAFPTSALPSGGRSRS